MFKALFELWLIGGIILTSVIVISVGLYAIGHSFSKKVPFEEYIKKRLEVNKKYHEAKNANPRPVFKKS